MTDMHRLNVAAPLPAIDNELMHLFSCGKISDTDTHGPIAQLFADVDEASIPFLTQAAITSGRLPPNALVRYRCLVQVFVLIVAALCIVPVLITFCY